MVSQARVRGHPADPLKRGEPSSSSTGGLLTARQDTGLPSAADFFVPSLPGIPNLATHPTHPLNVYSGLLPSYPGEGKGGGDGDTGKDAKLYFLMARARRSAGKQRVIFWFNGGPGCSSFDGALMEVGPFRTVPASQTTSGQVELKLVEGGWEEYATVVFIDQPPGTGLSYVPTNGYLHELDQGTQHLSHFLKNFYTVFPDLQGLDTYLAGESFAGQYIPYFAHTFIQSPPVPDFNLRGISIGNGWIDPKRQYPGYAAFAYEKGLIKKGTAASDALDQVVELCNSEIERFQGEENTPVNINAACANVMNMVTKPFDQELNGQSMCMNVYDIRLTDTWPDCGMNWPPDLPDVYSYLRRDDVIEALHAKEKSAAWVECDGKVSAELRLDSSFASVKYIPDILEAGVEVMMFAGAEDLICNYKGIEMMIESMEWSGAKGFTNETAEEWYFNGTKVGEWTSGRNMTYVKVYDSSHMVGFDVPEVTNDMITRFMGIDLSLVPGGLGQAKGRLGSVDKLAWSVGSSAAGIPLIKSGQSSWDSWYNAGSAVLILLILCSGVAMYFYFRRRSPLRRRLGLPTTRDYDADAAERVPLGAERVEMDDIERAGEYELRDDKRSGGSVSRGKGKGKGKAKAKERRSEDGETVFALGDDDEV